MLKLTSKEFFNACFIQNEALSNNETKRIDNEIKLISIEVVKRDEIPLMFSEHSVNIFVKLVQLMVLIEL